MHQGSIIWNVSALASSTSGFEAFTCRGDSRSGLLHMFKRLNALQYPASAPRSWSICSRSNGSLWETPCVENSPLPNHRWLSAIIPTVRVTLVSCEPGNVISHELSPPFVASWKNHTYAWPSWFPVPRYLTPGRLEDSANVACMHRAGAFPQDIQLSYQFIPLLCPASFPFVTQPIKRACFSFS